MVKLKTAILILGDILILYFSLWLTLVLRYGFSDVSSHFKDHFQPFTLIFIVWILIFYLADLYQIRKIKIGLELLRSLAGTIILSAVISVVFFYLFPKFFELTPKTNLAIFSVIFVCLDFIWRFTLVKSNVAKAKMLIIGNSPAIQSIAKYLESNPQIGYTLSEWIKADLRKYSFKDLEKIVLDNKIDIILIPANFIKDDLPIIKIIYQLLSLKIEVVNAYDFFEMIFQKEPLEELEESWFVEKITNRKNFYDGLKRFFDFVFGIIFLVIFSPLMLLIAISIRITSPGPAIFKQIRMGKNEKNFTLYKFRTMTHGGSGPLWTDHKNDNRVTKLGKILRFSHLDELPQLWNIARGDISFIGPRAERLELAEYYSSLPHYEIRHIIKPGFTGWAQLNYRPSASLEEAFEKLKYDIYYIKNRSVILDLLIVIRTIRLFFSNPE